MRLGGGAILALAVWALLVWVAIGFGRDARAGDGSAWFLVVAVGLVAVGCLFGALLLATAALRAVGIVSAPTPHKH